MDADQERNYYFPAPCFLLTTWYVSIHRDSPLSLVLQPSLRSSSSVVPVLGRNEILLAEFLCPKLRRSTRIALRIKGGMGVILSFGVIVEEDL